MFSFNEIKKFVILGIFAAIALIGLYFATRPVNKWICQNGSWVKQGNPKETRPLTPCR